MYLLAFTFLAPWQDNAHNAALVCDNNSGRRNYSALSEDNNSETTLFDGDSSRSCIRSDEDDDEEESNEPGTTLRNRPQQQQAVVSRLSESIFVPIKDHSSSHSAELSHTCNHSQSVAVSSSDEEEESSVRSVRFNQMAEVREMSPLDAPDALLARLSYSASLRMHRQKSHHKTARTALMFAVLVSSSVSLKIKTLNHSRLFFTVVPRQLLVPVSISTQ